MAEKKLKTRTVEEVRYEVDPPEEVRALLAQLAAAEARLDEYKEEVGSIQVAMRGVSNAVLAMRPPKLMYLKPKVQKVSTPIALVIHNTDWHMGAVQDADEIEGFNEFSPAILGNRIINFARDVLSWTELHRASYHVDECRVLVTGDLISGDIHDELRVTNEWPSPRQAVEAGRLLAGEISLLSPHFKDVVVDFVTVDNHGRMTKKPQHKEGGYNTLNFPLAEVARLLLRDHKNVQFNIYPREQQVVEVKGQRYLLYHGHGIMGWAGFPYYGIQRKVAKDAVKRMRQRKAEFDRVILGHFHAPLRHPWYWIGGSASGTDALDHSQGREAEPCQVAWFVHPKHGEFDETNWMLRG